MLNITADPAIGVWILNGVVAPALLAMAALIFVAGITICIVVRICGCTVSEASVGVATVLRPKSARPSETDVPDLR